MEQLVCQLTWAILTATDQLTPLGSNIFLAEQVPRYWLAYGLSLFLVCSAILATVFMRILLVSANKKRDEMSEEDVRAAYSPEELIFLGDKSPLFRYVI